MLLEPADDILLADNKAENNHGACYELEVVGVHSDVVAVSSGDEHQCAVND